LKKAFLPSTLYAIMQQLHFFSDEIAARYGKKLYRIPLDLALGCPNRPDRFGDGCTFCAEDGSRARHLARHLELAKQVQTGIEFAAGRYGATPPYLAYFQSYTNTYDSLEKLRSIYEEALQHPRISGIVVGTRPDCVNDLILDYFEDLSKKTYVMIEYGIESTDNKTLEFINRGHDYQCAVDAINATAKRNIYTGAHLILGLPGESRETILSHADKMNELPITALKLHQLQLVKGTIMAKQAKTNPEWFQFYTAEEYIDLTVDFIERLSPDIAIERFVSQSPKDLLISPDWGLKNFEFVAKVEKRLEERNARQGRKKLRVES